MNGPNDEVSGKSETKPLDQVAFVVIPTQQKKSIHG